MAVTTASSLQTSVPLFSLFGKPLINRDIEHPTLGI
jgi:hypothetical protein